jgi:hypothetical protein
MVGLEGLVLDLQGRPLARVRIEALGSGEAAESAGSGHFGVRLSRADPRLRVGSPEGVAFVVRIAVGGGDGAGVVELPRAGPREEDLRFDLVAPFFLDAPESGVAQDVPAGVQAAEVRVRSLALESLELRIPPGGTVRYPADGAERVFLLAVGSEKLPLAFPSGRFSRLAVFVGPSGAAFSPAAELTLPNSDGLGPGARADLFELRPESGLWEKAGEMVVSADGASLRGGAVTHGGLYAALPRPLPPETTVVGFLRGRGGEAVEGSRVLIPGGRAAVSDDGGFFEAAGVAAPAEFQLRLQVLAPRDFDHEFLFTGSLAPVPDGDTDFGVIQVEALPRTDIPPAVSYNPADGAVGVDERTRVLVTFGRRMVLESTGIQLVRGVSRDQEGIEATLAVRFLDGERTQLEFVPRQPLASGTFYTVFVPERSRDEDGNRVAEEDALSRFTVRATPAVPGPGDVIVRSSSPYFGRAGDEVEVLGQNLSVDVRFGGVAAQVLRFDSARRESVTARVPAGIAGEVQISVSGQGALPFRALPVLAELDIGSAVVTAGGSVELSGRGLHLGTSPQVVFNGVRGGSFRSVDPAGDCPAGVGCFVVDLPPGPAAGSLFLEVQGFPSESRPVVLSRPQDAVPPAVVSSTVAGGEEVEPAGVIVLGFSELLDGRSTVAVEAAGAPLAGTSRFIVHREDATSEITVFPPAAGFPSGVLLRIVAADLVRDLADNPLDQDPEAAGRQPFVVEFRSLSQ